MDIVHDIRMGMSTGAYHIKWFVLMKMEELLMTPIRTRLGYENLDSLQKKNSLDIPLKVACVGFGRTGTYSIKLALDQLGYPTLHTQHLYESPKILDMWTESVFKPVIKSGELSLGHPDFDLITSHGFTAVADLPMAFYFEELHRLYPDCKFILTTRESSDAWFKSWNLLTGNIAKTTQMTGIFARHVQQIQLYLRWMYGLVNKDVGILTTPLQTSIPPQIRERAIASYEEHNNRVRQVIPPHLLLEYDVNSGWEPLCTFLNIDDCPKTPFPKTNSSLSVIVQTSTGLFIGTVSILLGLYSLYLLIRMMAKCFGGKNISSEIRIQYGATKHMKKRV